LSAEFLLNLNLNRLAEYAFAEEILLSKDKTDTIVMLARLEYQQGNVRGALKRLNDLSKDRADEAAVWASLGHYHYIMHQYDEAKSAYEKCLSLEKGMPLTIKILVNDDVPRFRLKEPRIGATSPGHNLLEAKRISRCARNPT
jgi:tetratricopeptide (TPR) repeat protein